MTRVITQEIESHFNSLNGGWPGIKGDLADVLVGNGLDNFYEGMRMSLKNSAHLNRENDICFLVRGIRSLDQSDLEDVTSSLSGIFSVLKRIDEEIVSAKNDLAVAKEEWIHAAESFKPLLEFWKGLMLEKKEMSEFSCGFIVDPNFFLEKDFFVNHADSGEVMTSFAAFESNRANFDALLSKVKSFMENSYMRADLPCSVFDFDEALNNFLAKSSKVDDLLKSLKEKQDRYASLREGYWSKRTAVVRRLDSMSDAAKWAWFWISHPEL